MNINRFIKRMLPLSFVCIAIALLLGACSDDVMEEVVSPDERRTTLPISPLARAVADSMTMTDFRRCYGVGYSYNAIDGERCNPRDVHSRVISLDALYKWAAEESGNRPLFSTRKTDEATYMSETAFNHSQITQRTNVAADLEAKCILFNGSVVAGMQMWESGQANNFFCTASYHLPALSMHLDGVSIAALITKYGRTDLLTPNFRDAIDWLDKHREDCTVDSFLACYGSHVVSSAELGATMTLNMTMQHDSLMDFYSKEALGNAAIGKLIKANAESTEYKKELNLLNSADCQVTFKGGNLDAIPNEMLHFTFGQQPDLSAFVKNWTSSLNYDLNDYRHCNLEMTDMAVKPIWKFIPNAEVAELVKNRVQGTAADLIQSVGYQNFANVSFRIPQSVTCKMGEQDTSFNQPDVINVIAQGRYVATICHEQIDLPDQMMADVQVVYPIYNQQVNLRSGYCVHEGKAYSVCWLQNGRLKVEEVPHDPSSDDDHIYMTHGVIGSTRYANIHYAEGHPVIGYEWPKSIKIDGSIDRSTPYYLVYKVDNRFLLRDKMGNEQEGEISGLPNWAYEYGRMVRNKDYIYYWNPNEVSY